MSSFDTEMDSLVGDVRRDAVWSRLAMGHRALWIALAIVALAGALRVQHAGTRRSLWGDEAHEVGMVTDAESAPELVRLLVKFDSHPPLPYLLDWSVVQIWGADALLSRTPFVILGTLAVALLMLMAWRRFGPACALLSGLLAACSPYLVYTSGMLRYGALLCAVTPLWGMAFLRFEERRDTKSAIVWGLASALAAYVHYHAVFAIVAGGLFLLAQDRSRSNLGRLTLAAVVFSALFGPWVPSLLAQLEVDRWGWSSARTDPALVLTVLRLVPHHRTWLILLLTLGLGAATVRRERGAFFALTAASFGGAFLAWATHFFRGAFEARYMVGLVLLGLPPSCWYLARMGRVGPVVWWRGLSSGRLYRMSPRAHGAIGIVFVATLLVSQFLGVRARQETRGVSPMALVAATVADLERPGDLVVVCPTRLTSPYHHHNSGTTPIIAPPYPATKPYRTPERVDASMDACLAQIREVLAANGRIWLVTVDLESGWREHEMPVRETLFRHGVATHTFPFDERDWDFAAKLVLIEAR